MFITYIDNIINHTQINMYLILLNQAFPSQSKIILMQAKSRTINTSIGKYSRALVKISFAIIIRSFHQLKL